jgi:hypothetical protein
LKPLTLVSEVFGFLNGHVAADCNRLCAGADIPLLGCPRAQFSQMGFAYKSMQGLGHLRRHLFTHSNDAQVAEYDLT